MDLIIMGVDIPVEVIPELGELEGLETEVVAINPYSHYLKKKELCEFAKFLFL